MKSLPLVAQLFQCDFQLTAQQIDRIIGVDAQNLLHGHNAGLAIEDHAGIR